MERSENIGQLAAALAKAQKQYKPLKKESMNPFYNKKYAELSAVIDATKDALADNELSIIQLPGTDGAKVKIRTVLAHSSGEFLAEDLLLTLPVFQDKETKELRTKEDPQSVAICVTYGRRIAYQAFVGIAADSDDDGNEASGKTNVQPSPKPQPKVNQVPAQPKNDPRPKEQGTPLSTPNATAPSEPVQKTDDLPTKDELKAIQTDVREWAKKVDKEQLIAFIRKTANQEDSKLITKTQWSTIFGMLKQAEALSLDKLKEIVGGKSE